MNQKISRKLYTDDIDHRLFNIAHYKIQND